MPTGVAGGQGRHLVTQQIHYMRKGFTFADDGVVLDVGELPGGALILGPLSGVQVNVAFNDTVTNVLDIGTTADADLYATDLALGTIGFIPIDEAVSRVVAVNTKITATVDLTGTGATTGEGEIVIAFIPDNDG